MDNIKPENIMPVKNETEISCFRYTRENKKITYKLKVLQQPEQARACGSGAKSSADRRPVDPPPIVELRIYEGEAAERDITLAIKANYFLFATLEPARFIAKAPGLDSSRLCVLTGTPVAGMVYLVRPAQAGYFVFPDLSVRHEGSYRLSFNLYEELKCAGDYDRVADAEDNSQEPIEAHVIHRLEVKSTVFQVYSAKKFPGLNSSTDLSRTVAEQGCRVRIRRDIRQRKRTGKDEKDEYGYEDEGRRGRSPERFPGSPRRGRSSSSCLSNLAPAPSSRRNSQEHMNPMYHSHGYHPYPVPPAGQIAYTQPVTSPYGAQFNVAAPAMHGAMPPPSSSLQMLSYGYAPPAPASANPAYYPGYPKPHHAPAQQSYDTQQQQHVRTASYDLSQQYQHDPYANAGHSQPPPPPPSYSHAPPQSTMPQQSATYGMHSGYTGYAMMPEPARTSSFSAESSAAGKLPPAHRLPPLNTSLPASREKLLEASPISAGPVSRHYDGMSSAHYPQAAAPNTTKRSYSSVFNPAHVEEPLRSGARPSDASSYTSNGYTNAEYSSEDFRSKLSYRRADGSAVSRSIPAHSR